jgi:pimeloyl-ACP methyl ester carboxylesterase
MQCDTGQGILHYELIELTPPWLEEPPTVVFCHGVATDAHIWEDWLPALIPHMRIMRFDTRGFGRSAGAAPPVSWTIDRFADDIVAVARAAGAERFHLIGESFGGTASLHLATRPRSPVVTLSCVSTSHRGGSMELVRQWRDAVRRNGIQTWSEQMMERRFVPGMLDAARTAWFARTQAATDAEALIAIGELLIRTDLTDALSRIQAPTLLLTPDSSPFVTVELSNQVRQAVPGSEMAVFANARHGLPFSHARECAQTVLAFLQRHGHALD